MIFCCMGLPGSCLGTRYLLTQRMLQCTGANTARAPAGAPLVLHPPRLLQQTTQDGASASLLFVPFSAGLQNLR